MIFFAIRNHSASNFSTMLWLNSCFHCKSTMLFLKYQSFFEKFLLIFQIIIIPYFIDHFLWNSTYFYGCF